MNKPILFQLPSAGKYIGDYVNINLVEYIHIESMGYWNAVPKTCGEQYKVCIKVDTSIYEYNSLTLQEAKELQEKLAKAIQTVLQKASN